MIFSLLAALALSPLFAETQVRTSSSTAGFMAAAAEVSSATAAAPVATVNSVTALRSWFMDDAETAPEPAVFRSTETSVDKSSETAALRALAGQVRFLRRGRVAGLDDWQAYSEMTALVARRLEIKPAESALPAYRGRLRKAEDALTPEEKAIHDELLANDKAPGIAKRYLFIADLVGTPSPAFEIQKRRTIIVKNKKGKKIKKVIEPPELAPPPESISVVGRIDWTRADELAEVADDNAHGWDRKPKESLRRYNRRLRHLRAHCYEWVRHDLEALGIWDANLFRGFVPPTRRDRQRPIRAASFALAMAKITSSEKIAAKTALRELNLRVDPLVRGAIVVFAPKICDYNARDGHIEIITSVEPLQAASFKFHPVKTECLVKAANENKVHVYVPLRRSDQTTAAVGGR